MHVIIITHIIIQLSGKVLSKSESETWCADLHTLMVVTEPILTICTQFLDIYLKVDVLY